MQRKSFNEEVNQEESFILPQLQGKSTSLRNSRAEIFDNFPSSLALIPQITQNSIEKPLQTLTLQLFQMGFDDNEIKKIVSRVGVLDVIEMVDYLLKDKQNKYLHKYTNLRNQEIDECEICGENKNSHQDKEVNLRITPDFNNRGQIPATDNRIRNKSQEIFSLKELQYQALDNQR